MSMTTDTTGEPQKSRRTVKKSKKHSGSHGGAWKVAYADFVTAMMALFLVLWLVSQADMKIKQSIASYFRAPGIFDSVSGGILPQAKKVSREPTSLTSKDEESLFSVSQDMQKKFANRLEFSSVKDQIQVELTDEGLKVEIRDKGERVLFPSGSKFLTPEYQRVLMGIAADLCDLPNKINIGGHTDSYLYAASENYTNWELSIDRANAARRVLESACIKPDRIHRVIGFGSSVPLVPEDPYNPANRRITITVLRLLNSDIDDTTHENHSAKSLPVSEKPLEENSDEDSISDASRSISERTN